MGRPKILDVFAQVEINGRVSRFVFKETELARLEALGAVVTRMVEPDPLFKPKEASK